MLDALDDLSPRVEAVDIGVALVDVTGLGPMWGPERRIAARAVMLVRGVAPLRVRCGIGDNRWLATLAARLARFERPEAPAAFHAIDRREALRDLPLGLLPADPATRQRFVLFGLTAMAQLADLPRSAVGAQFGAAGERLQALARGHDPRPIVPRRRPERVEASAAFEPPLDGIGAVGLTLRRLAAELCDRLGERHLAPGRAVLSLLLEDAPPLRVAQPFPQPALEPDWIARLLLSRVEAAARDSTQCLAKNRRPSHASHRSCSPSIGSPIRRPGSCPRSRPAPGAGRSCAGRSSGSGIGSERGACGERRTNGRPRHCPSNSRDWSISANDAPLREPPARPGRHRCGRRARCDCAWTATDHGELGICNRWRVDDGWWREPVARACYKVVTRSGLLCVVFLDEVRGTWHLERVFD